MQQMVWGLNTSHVLIYRKYNVWKRTRNEFKYISCSYLSFYILPSSIHEISLNTSHVLIYRKPVFSSNIGIKSLNTSHVLIYLDKTVEFTRIPRGFKYISCSYLSRQSGTVGRRERSLNTSHVLIYQPLQSLTHAANLLFKYISCSYLSREPA